MWSNPQVAYERTNVQIARRDSMARRTDFRAVHLVPAAASHPQLPGRIPIPSPAHRDWPWADVLPRGPAGLIVGYDARDCEVGLDVVLTVRDPPRCGG